MRFAEFFCLFFFFLFGKKKRKSLNIPDSQLCSLLSSVSGGGF